MPAGSLVVVVRVAGIVGVGGKAAGTAAGVVPAGALAPAVVVVIGMPDTGAVAAG